MKQIIAPKCDRCHLHMELRAATAMKIYYQCDDCGDIKAVRT